MHFKKLMPILAAVLLSGMPALAVTPAPQQTAETAKEAAPTFYNLLFRVIDRDGKRIVSSRSYKVSIGTDRTMSNARVRAQDFFTVPGGASRKIGFYMNINRCVLIGDSVALTLDSDLTSLPTEGETGAPSGLIRNNGWGAAVLLQLNTPTIVYSADDPVSTDVFEVELTVSPMGVAR